MTTTLITGAFGPHIKTDKADPTYLDISLLIDGELVDARLNHTMDDTDLDRLWLGTIYKHVGETIDATRKGDKLTAFGYDWTILTSGNADRSPR